MRIDKDWKVEITKADNGFIMSKLEELIGEKEDEEPTYRRYNTVYAFDEDSADSDKEEAKALMNLFWDVLSEFGVRPSKHENWEITMQVKDKKDES